MRLLIPEILKEVSDAPAKERSNILKKHSSNVLLKEILMMNFNNNIEFDLPAGEPPYKVNPQPVGLTDTNLYAESRRFYLLIKGHPKRPQNLKKLQMENIFVQILEGCNKIEAEMMISLKDKKLSKLYPGLTEKVVREAFPDLLPKIEGKTEVKIS